MNTCPKCHALLNVKGSGSFTCPKCQAQLVAKKTSKKTAKASQNLQASFQLKAVKA